VAETYRQQLPNLDLAVERATERTPDENQFHVFYRGELVGSHKKLLAAQAQFKQLRDESGWTPPERKDDLTPEQKLARERELYQRSVYLEYWSQSHKFRGGGRPKRK
jgi:hypothetical protein